MSMPTVIDLFAGVGGLSLSAARAGFRVVAAVENDPFALETHTKNFPSTTHIERDVKMLDGKSLLACADVNSVDGIIGGPPCQGFSAIGHQDENDSRNNLFHHFFQLVSEVEPKFYLAENVPGIMSTKFDFIRAKALSQIPSSYRILPPFEVTASDYGAPTSRTRVFFVGYKSSEFKPFESSIFYPPNNIPITTVGEALRGLPRKIDPQWITEKLGWRKVRALPDTFYYDKIVGQIPLNVGNPMAIINLYDKKRVSGCMGTRHSDEVSERYGKVLQGGQDKVSKSPKLHPKKLCPTLRAGTGKDKGSYQAVRPLHPTEKRVITPREAARLQGFPDWFVFHRTKWHSFRQIGNSVSPFVGEYLLKAIHDRISCRQETISVPC